MADNIKLFTLKCPNCGASISLPENSQFGYRDKTSRALNYETTPVCALYDGGEWKMIDASPSTLVKNYP